MIRLFKEEDTDFVNKLGQELKDDFNIKKRSNLEQVIVYVVDNKILGFVTFIKLYETVEILYIIVDKDTRKKGIGSKLLNYLCLFAGIKEIILEVRETNEIALKFYQKYGFEKQRIIKNYYSNNENAIQMKRVIE